jgi:hypothetical protein
MDPTKQISHHLTRGTNGEGRIFQKIERLGSRLKTRQFEDPLVALDVHEAAFASAFSNIIN